MSTSKKTLAVLAALAMCAAVFGQSGDFQTKGRVLVNGQPLAMASITYLNLNQRLLWDFSKTDGTFGMGALPTTNPLMPNPRISIPTDGDVTIDVFEMSGRHAGTVTEKLDKGMYTLQPLRSRLSQSMYMLRIKAGNIVTYQKLLNTGSGNLSLGISPSSSEEPMVMAKKLAAIDSIRIGKTGYTSVVVPITTYADNVGDQTLKTINIDSEVTALMSTMSNAQKFGQLCMPPNLYNNTNTPFSSSDATKYAIGSLFGGGGALTGSSASASASYINGVQQAMMNSSLKIPIMAAYDFVHGASAVPGATLFPHNLAMGAIRTLC